jgi:signal transduction histidine kinase
MKASPVAHGTPILLLTARNDREWVLQGFNSGADDYLAKPFNSDELHARVDVQIRLRRLMNESVQREKLALLGSVAAGLAHEIRNPVTAMLAGLPRLARELDSVGVRPAAKEMLKVAIDSAERVSRIVGDVLTLGAPERPDVVPYDLREGLDAAIRVLEHKASQEVRFERDYDFDGTLNCRPGAIGQVFLNLLDNALHAVGPHGQIKVTLKEQDKGVAVRVADSGPGIPPQLRERIFDPFFTTKEIGVGTGLGLHVSRQIVYAHKGTLTLLPTSAGATFQVWLPLGEQ